MMKKKTMIILIAVLVLLIILCLTLCTRKDANSSRPDSNLGNIEQENDNDLEDDVTENSEHLAIEDEVTLDYSGANEDETDMDSTEGTGDETEMPKMEESNKENSSIENGIGDGSTDSKNPYDKDGDGFVDGWY